MKKTIFSALMLITASMSVNAQVVMRFEMNDGSHVDYPVSSVKSVSWIEEETKTPAGLEAVDLGLSVKWANMNVGASSPEDYGWYLAWGETEPKATYNWDTYFDSVNGSSINFKKYYNNGGKTTLDLEDDAAHVNWGGDWRMPTLAEQDELCNTANCTWSWTTQNGVKGYKVTSKKNGNSIFFPAADSRDYVWSSSLHASNSSGAYFLYFDSSSVAWSSFYRYYGFSVRAVCP